MSLCSQMANGNHGSKAAAVHSRCRLLALLVFCSAVVVIAGRGVLRTRIEGIRINPIIV